MTMKTKIEIDRDLVLNLRRLLSENRQPIYVTIVGRGTTKQMQIRMMVDEYHELIRRLDKLLKFR